MDVTGGQDRLTDDIVRRLDRIEAKLDGAAFVPTLLHQAHMQEVDRRFTQHEKEMKELRDSQTWGNRAIILAFLGLAVEVISRMLGS